MKKTLGFMLLAFLILLLSACAPGPNFIVNSQGDEADSQVGDGLCETANQNCTLRAALMEANFSNDVNVITFQGVSMIQPTIPLPKLESGNIQIDGNGDVVLDGSLIEHEINDGLVIFNSSYNVIKGLTIQHFDRAIFIRENAGYSGYNQIGLAPGDTGDGTERNMLILNGTGIQIHGENVSDNSVSGNHIGIGPNGQAAQPNEFTGIMISGGAYDNLIGSLTGSDINQGGNLISGNGGTGLLLKDSSNNQVSGNIIGLNKDGNTAVPNLVGVLIQGSNNVVGIGPTGEGYRNLISGNIEDGITLQGSDYNIIAGNRIGTNHNGTSAIPNRNGIYLTAGSSSNIIGTNGDGTSDADEGNLVSGNNEAGIVIADDSSSGNRLAGNLIGTDLTGTSSLGNAHSGVLSAGSFTLIGTDGDGDSDALEGNVISGNGTVGVDLYGLENQVAGNFIGTNSAGTIAIGNAFEGILIHENAYDNLIGTNADGISDVEERNIISGNGLAMNGDAGIVIESDDNVVAGNYVGTDASGTNGLGNLQYGIILTSTASANIVGTNGDGAGDASEGNLVSGNGWGGIWLLGATANRISGNIVGADISGTAAIPNGHAVESNSGAINLSGGASLNYIGTNGNGTSDHLEGNLISGNNLNGIALWDSTTHHNRIAGNMIGTDITGTTGLGNLGGISIYNGSHSNRIGTNGDGNSDIVERNIISANSRMGIFLQGGQTTIAGNFIGADATGTGDLGNGNVGVYVTDGYLANIIGGSQAKANLIAFNGRDGIQVFGAGLTQVNISRNSIHSNVESGIDLQELNGQGTWFTPNDPGDVDQGPNDLMNYPDLSGATLTSPYLKVSGGINDGLQNTSFKLEFFANDSCDSPGDHGEGQTYLGSTQVTTDSSGNANFLASLPVSVQPGSFVTATATTSGRTSEFSECVEVFEAVDYSQPLEENRCDLFDQDDVTVVTSEVDPAQLYLYLYLKNSSGFPGLDYEVPDDQDEWLYRAVLGEVESTRCGLQGIAGRLYCDFNLPANYLQTSKELQVFVNGCTPPIYVIDNVSIFELDDTPDRVCSSNLNENACIARGGSYNCDVTGGACTCDCP